MEWMSPTLGLSIVLVGVVAGCTLLIIYTSSSLLGSSIGTALIVAGIVCGGLYSATAETQNTYLLASGLKDTYGVSAVTPSEFPGTDTVTEPNYQLTVDKASYMCRLTIPATPAAVPAHCINPGSGETQELSTILAAQNSNQQ